MAPAIKNVHGDKVVAVWDTHGGKTEGEVKSIKGRSQAFTGVGNQAGPGGRNWIGGFVPGFSRGKSGLGNLPVVKPIPPSSSVNGGYELEQ